MAPGIAAISGKVKSKNLFEILWSVKPVTENVAKKMINKMRTGTFFTFTQETYFEIDPFSN